MKKRKKKRKIQVITFFGDVVIKGNLTIENWRKNEKIQRP